MADNIEQAKVDAKKTSYFIHSIVLDNAEEANPSALAYQKLMDEIDKESKKNLTEAERKAWADQLKEGLKDILPELSAAYARENLGELGTANKNNRGDSIYTEDLTSKMTLLKQDLRGQKDNKLWLTDQLELSMLATLHANREKLADKFDDDGTDAERISVNDIDAFLKESFDQRSTQRAVRAEAVKLLSADKGGFFKFLDGIDGDNKDGVTKPGLETYLERRDEFVKAGGKAEGFYWQQNYDLAKHLLDNWNKSPVNLMRVFTAPFEPITMASLAKGSGVSEEELMKLANPAVEKKDDPPKENKENPVTENKEDPPKENEENPVTENKEDPSKEKKEQAKDDVDKPIAHTIAKGEWIWKIIRRDYSNEKGFDPSTRREIYNWILNNNGPAIKANPELIYETKTLYLPPAKMFVAK